MNKQYKFFSVSKFDLKFKKFLKNYLNLIKEYDSGIVSLSGQEFYTLVPGWN